MAAGEATTGQAPLSDGPDNVQDPESAPAAPPAAPAADKRSLDTQLSRSESQDPERPRDSAWASAARKVKLSLSIVNRLSTLRDRYGINEIELSELKLVKKLGEGAFATVEQCLYTPKAGGEPVMVAVKKLNAQAVAQQEDLLSFMREVALMRKLKHKHIVEYIGIGSTDKSSEERQRSTMFLVLELVTGATLKKLVMRQMTEMHRPLYSDEDALRWCTEIADALAYIHEAKPTVIHRDLKLENILLKGTSKNAQEVKLADFGLAAFTKQTQPFATGAYARITQAPAVADDAVNQVNEKAHQFLERLTSQKIKAMPAMPPPDASVHGTVVLPVKAREQMSGRTGTLMYMAPEMFREEGYDEKVDVFSFGVIMYELLHKYMMVFAVSVAGTEQEIEMYAAKVASGWRPPLSDKFPEEVLSIIRAAWAQNPQDRPTMRELYNRLLSLKSLPAFAANDKVQPNPGCGCAIS